MINLFTIHSINLHFYFTNFYLFLLSFLTLFLFFIYNFFLLFFFFLKSQLKKKKKKSKPPKKKGPTSAPNSCASSPPVLIDEPSSPSRMLLNQSHNLNLHLFSNQGGKPQTIRRGPGRPRKEFTPGMKMFNKENRVIKR